MQIPPYTLTSWLEENEAASMYTYDYWNDREVEKSKAWDVTQHGFEQMQDHIENRGLFSQLVDLCSGIELEGCGLSLASGTCWLEAKMLKEFAHINRIHCLDFSKHRIHEIAPQVLGHFGIREPQVNLIHGSFYEIKMEPESCDFIVLCQAFHHAEEPEKILDEMRRVLKPKGHIVIMGEHFFSLKEVALARLKFHVKWIINYKQTRHKSAGISPSYQDLFPTSLEKGDIHYAYDQYRRLFEKYDFDFKHRVMAHLGIQGFLLSKRD